MSSKTIQDVTAIENVLVREDKNSLSISRGKNLCITKCTGFQQQNISR